MNWIGTYRAIGHVDRVKRSKNTLKFMVLYTLRKAWMVK